MRLSEHRLRYANKDGFGTPETAFDVCAFCMIAAQYLVRRSDEARSLFKTMFSHITSSELLSEDLDCETGELWGNFSQSYSLMCAINRAGLLLRPLSEVRC